MDWFRSWHGAPTDDKWIVIAKRSETQVYAVSAFVWALFDHASKNEQRGHVAGFDFETYSAKSGMDEEVARRIYSALEKYPTGNEIIKEGQLVNWEKRQPKLGDNSTDRVRKYREKKRSETLHETNGNTDTDTDTDTDKKVSPKGDTRRSRAKPDLEKPADVSENTWKDFVDLRKSKRAPLTETALEGIRAEAAKADWNLQSALAECCLRGWQGFKAEWVQNRGQAPPKKDHHGNRQIIAAQVVQEGRQQ